MGDVNVDQYIAQYMVPKPPPSRVRPASDADFFDSSMMLGGGPQPQHNVRMSRPVAGGGSPMYHQGSAATLQRAYMNSPGAKGDMTLIPGLHAPARSANYPQAVPATLPAGSIRITFAGRNVETPTVTRDVAPVKSLRVGRLLPESSNDPFFLGYGSKVVSRLHGEIFLKGGDLFYKDTHSAAGTYLNGIKLAPEQMVRLKPGDVMQLGMDYPGQRAVVFEVHFARN